MHWENVPISDYHDIFNSIGIEDPPIAPVPSVVSFDVEWKSNDSPVQIRDQTNDFAGMFMTSLATIQWSARQPSTNFMFQSDPASTSTTVSGVIGHEHNGRFMPGPG